MIDILIPTYNRRAFLIPNLSFLEQEIAQYNLENIVKIIVYDNASNDGSYDAVVSDEELRNTNIFRHEKNVGLERNALSVLNASEAKYVMFLGDDDRLPRGYLNLVVDHLSNDNDIGLVLPGITARYESGEDVNVKRAGSKQEIIKSGFISQLKYGYLTHQLSGCVFKRDGIFEAYERLEENKNIYPFIFFALYCQQRFSSLYLPNMKVKVLEGNKKDWAYNDVGLLDEIAKNYLAIFKGSCFKVSLCLMYICYQQSWRLRTNSVSNHVKAIKFLFNTPRICSAFKIAIVPVMFPFLIKNVILKHLLKLNEK